MSKRGWIIGVGATAVALAAGISQIDAAISTLDKWKIPRPVATPELEALSERIEAVADVAVDGNIRGLLLQKDQAEQRATDLQVLIEQSRKEGQAVPEALVKALDEKLEAIDDYEQQIIKLKTSQP